MIGKLLSRLICTLQRLGLTFKSGSYSFYSMECRVQEFDCNPALDIFEVNADDISSDNIFGWLSIEEAKSLIASPNNRMFLMTEGGKPIASCWSQIQNVHLDFLSQDAILPCNSTYITHVIVRPCSRGKGAARYLLTRLINLLSEEKAGRVYICCDSENYLIRRVFHEIGFNFYLAIKHLELTKLKLNIKCNEDGVNFCQAPLDVFPEDPWFLHKPTGKNTNAIFTRRVR